MQVFISAGEASGDVYGAELWAAMQKRLPDATFESIRAEVMEVASRGLKQLAPQSGERTFSETWEVDDLENVEFARDLEAAFGLSFLDSEISGWKTNGDVVRCIQAKLGGRRHSFHALGMGSNRLREAGANLLVDTSSFGAISIFQSLKLLPRAIPLYLKVKRRLKRSPPGLFVAIDFGGINIRLAKFAKQLGWKVLYFIPPGCWRRDRQGADLPVITDAISTPFEWSAEILNGMGGRAHWFGHPIWQLVSKYPALAGDRLGIAVLPGSRHHEWECNLPVIAQALGDCPETLEFAISPNASVEDLKGRWKALAPTRNDRFTQGDLYGVLQRAEAAVVCSGTATLEAALCDCPMVVMYQISPAMRREAKLIRFKRPRFIALPNILVDREVVPELAELEGVSASVLRAAFDKVRSEPGVKEAQRAAFAEIRTMMGPPDAIDRTADLAVRLISGESA